MYRKKFEVENSWSPHYTMAERNGENLAHTRLNVRTTYGWSG